MPSGKVKWFNAKKGYGFITDDKTHKDILRHKTGQKFWESLEISIRHNEGINSNQPVLAKLWMFWGNFFAISEKDFLANYSTGPYHREIIRPNLNQTFEKMVYEVTTSWAMIHHLDNSESAGPKVLPLVKIGEEKRKDLQQLMKTTQENF